MENFQRGMAMKRKGTVHAKMSKKAVHSQIKIQKMSTGTVHSQMKIQKRRTLEEIRKPSEEIQQSAVLFKIRSELKAFFPTQIKNVLFFVVKQITQVFGGLCQSANGRTPDE